MITARDAVLAEAATYIVGAKPTFVAFKGAVKGFITEIADELLVAIQGTTTELAWGIDFWARLTMTKPIPGHPRLPPSHKGFTAVVDDCFDYVKSRVTKRKFHVIGHSLGGGVGQNLAARLADSGEIPQAVWLFASARCFVDAPDVLTGVPINAWRCGGDIVPMVPPWCWRPIMTHLPGPNDESSHAITNFTDQIK